MSEQESTRRPWRTIAIPADTAYWNDFKAVALEHDMTVGDAVKSAIDRVYGQALARKHAERGARKRSLVLESADDVQSE